MSVVEIEDGVFESTAVIDNGSFGTRTIRFETGRLAQQAAGSVVAYLDDETMLLSATTASKTPKDHFDFFPLTIDVEERMYAAGRIPGSFFRREGRPSTDAVLTCRLIDRPLRPTFISGLRNEVQVVVTIMSLDPNDLYDVLAINAASVSTQISGLPFNGPVGGVRVALIDGQWVAESPMGRIVVTMAPANDYGVLDHHVALPDGRVFYNPMRVLADDDGCEIVFTLRRQPGVSDEEFNQDAHTVREDLARLKAVFTHG